MKKLTLTGIICITLFLLKVTAQNTTSITGKIQDVTTKENLIGATISLVGDSLQGTISNLEGDFKLQNIPFGVHQINIRYLGYEAKTIRDIAIYDTKGTHLLIDLKPQAQGLKEVTVSAYENPIESSDPLAVVSTRSISIEETKRFAGSLGDPARMALSYAGVNSGRSDNNDILIRGNSAKYLQWKLEGLPIPNPNHFGVYGSSGGLLNILNANNLGRSNFHLGAFPVHTGNALAGVFDLSLRNGNQENHKHSLETSLIGLSASSEGPLSSNQNANYIVNYRYSTLGLMKNLNIVFQAPDYQDITFKVDLPTQRFGQFSIYGLGGLGTSLETEFFRKIDSTQFSTNARGDRVYGFQEIAAEDLQHYNIGILGIKHQINLHQKHILTNHINYSIVSSQPRSSALNKNTFQVFPKSEGRFNNSTVRYQADVSSYWNENNLLQVGIIFSFGFFNSKLKEGFPDFSSEIILDNQANSLLVQGFVAYQNTAVNRLKVTAGIHYTFFDLNQQQVIEPRLSLEYELSERSNFAFATGLHSSTESPEVYLTLDDNNQVNTRNLKMSRSWQTVLSFQKKFTDNLLLTTELYYQYLFDVPVSADSSNISLINEELAFTNISLANEGEGLNYGLDVTLEKFFAKSYYFLITASLFQSEYKLPNQAYRKTKYSNSYVFNLLGGKEFKLKTNQFLGLNIRGTFSGGRPYVPVLLAESIEFGEEIRDEKNAYTQQLPTYIGIDFSLNYRWIKSKTAHEIKLDIFRVFEQNYIDEIFVPQRVNRDGSLSPATTKQIQFGEGQTATTLLPVLYYKLAF